MSTIKFPEPVKFYKKKAELQVKLKKPEVADGKITNDGCVFFEMANAIPNDPDGRIDWGTKIIMKIGLNDIAQLLTFMKNKEKPVTLFHKTQAGSSTFEIKKGQPDPKGNDTFGVRISKKTGEQSSQSVLYLAEQDITILEEVLKSAVPTMLGWN